MQKSFPIIAGFCLLVLAVWLQMTSVKPVAHLISRLQDIAYDIQLQTRRLTHHPKQDSPIVIVDIDDRSISKLGRWPWPRTALATLTDHLKKAGAAVLAFDIIFPENETNPANTVMEALRRNNLASPGILAALQKTVSLLENDAQFAASLSRMDTVLGVSFLPRKDRVGELPHTTVLIPGGATLRALNTLQGYLANIPILQNAAKSGGFINMFPDEDGIVRRTPLLLMYDNRVYPSLALEAATVYLLSKLQLKVAHYYDDTRLEGITIGNSTIPVDERAQALIPFQGGSYYFPYYSAYDVMVDHFPAEAFSGKIVFIGTSATSLGDLRATAIQNIYPGVEIHATIAWGILNNAFSSKPSWARGAEISLTFFLGLVCIFLFPAVGPKILALLIIVIPLTLLFLNNWIWQTSNMVFSVFIPASFAIALSVVNILYGYFFETRHREKLRAMFGQYVPEKHITEMLEKPGEYTLYGEDRNMTVLFADIRDFTHISENLTADQLKDLLNAFFTPMTEIIFQHNGTIDKYVGDMIMAFWGAPLADPEHAKNAILAAIDMQKMVVKLQEVFAEKNWPVIQIGIGLNTGIMSVGDMGSQFRRNYTVLGDAVNLGSRVEGLTKFYGVKTIVTQNTYDGQNEFVFRHLDRVRVKGKQAGVNIYEPLCSAHEASDPLLTELKQHTEALGLYFSQNWHESEILFAELENAHPDTRIYQIYLRRIRSYLENPPPPEWDGVYVHTSK